MPIYSQGIPNYNPNIVYNPIIIPVNNSNLIQNQPKIYNANMIQGVLLNYNQQGYNVNNDLKKNIYIQQNLPVENVVNKPQSTTL